MNKAAYNDELEIGAAIRLLSREDLWEVSMLLLLGQQLQPCCWAVKCGWS